MTGTQNGKLFDVSSIVLIENRLLHHKITEGLKSKSIIFYDAEKSTDAIKLYQQFEPDSILIEGKLLTTKPGLATKLKKAMPNIKIVAVGNPEKLASLSSSGTVDHVLSTPFTPDNVPSILFSMLHPERSDELETDILFGERKWKKFCVSDVRLRIYHPFYEITDVLELSYLGLRANTQKARDLTVSSEVKLEIISNNGNFNLEGIVSWIKDNQIGVMFSKPKPLHFRTFISRLSVAV